MHHNLQIESGIEIAKVNRSGRKQGTGSSEEYFIGKEIYDNLNIGDSVFLSDSEYNEKAVKNRLYRLVKMGNDEKRFIFRKETKKSLKNETYGYGNIPIGYNTALTPVYEDIEGFRIHRIK